MWSLNFKTCACFFWQHLPFVLTNELWASKFHFEMRTRQAFFLSAASFTHKPKTWVSQCSTMLKTKSIRSSHECTINEWNIITRNFQLIFLCLVSLLFHFDTAAAWSRFLWLFDWRCSATASERARVNKRLNHRVAAFFSLLCNRKSVFFRFI